ncbi:MAG: monovalent cation/H+ antiporter subunit D family protein [Rhodobiaceae bacterium]|jgi:multicomponent Na+:H+ antiporter subunit D|nr:monovalent cation/H+ antiporter subunit D family protein [Rhodobiaceae bacterium]MBT5640676.1 monovalent cation/H+ antiporter subunit D family protein [Rhodobiaceae bacterium]MBT6223304.1 monovalent cation/H+ antiporter subunit D family protein [Rhodobiaceae bacterium]MDC3272851.1 monovalent cation/H+ antiporter subunit D family protein [Hyphomicrobiales bacterium]
MQFEHLPATQILIPLIGAILILVSRKNIVIWATASLLTLLTFINSILLYKQVSVDGVISYAMGGWEPPIGIEYRIDSVNSILIVLVSFMALLVAVYARKSVEVEIVAEKRPVFYAMYLLCLTGLLGILATGDAFNAFVFLEISSLATYVMIAMGKDKRSLIASYQYLIMGTIGATFYVIGIGLIFIMTGSLNLNDISEQINSMNTIRPILASLAFITVGISLKLALFPLHSWLPNAYAYAPSVATAFLASTATKVAVYLLIRYFFDVYGYNIVFEDYWLSMLLIILSIAAMIGASLVAIFQNNIKKMFAYSSIAQMGYITLGIAIANHSGLVGSLVHIINHALIKGTIFMAIGCFVMKLNSTTIEDFSGIGKKMPLTMTAFTIASLSLIGIPGTVGFISKWYIITGAIEKGWWWLVISIALSSLLALIYVGRIIEIAWFQESKTKENTVTLSREMIGVTLIASITTLYFGLNTELTVDLAKIAADSLLPGILR